MPSELPAGPTTFEITNDGTIEHNFEVEGQGIEEELPENLAPGATGTLTVDLAPGTYEVYCPVGNHEDEGMRVELTVTDASPAQLVESSTVEGDATSQTEAAEPTAVPTERPVPTPTPTPLPGSSQSNPAPIGTTLESQGLAVTVDSAYFDYGFANAIPRGGYKVMILGVTIENVSDENRGYDASRFSGIDAVTANTYDPVTVDDVGVLLTDGDLQPGEFVSGTALIEVQETATNVIIKYDADIVGDEEDMYWS
jgi:hypothetical protein